MPQRKTMKIKTGLRTASKVQENQLISAGKWLADHPDAVIPKCEDDDRRCNFSKIASKISLVSKNRSDQSFLTRMAKRGDPIVRAYAATILLSVEEHAPYLAVARGTEGDIAFAYSPKVRREPLIGLQYFKDPHLRLLAYAHLARKRKLVFYATKDSVYCSAEGGKVPGRFIDETAGRLSLSKKDKTNYSCGHNLDERGYLQISFKSNGISLMVCEKCLSEDRKFIIKTVERIISRDVKQLFDVKAMVRLECNGECAECPSDEMRGFSLDDMREYVAGNISDKKMYEMATEGHLDSVKESSKRVLILGKKCFGSDNAAFAEALATTSFEKDAIMSLLKAVNGPVVVPGNMTTNKFLAHHWDEHGSHLMHELVEHPKGEEPPRLSDNFTPMMAIERAKSHKKASMINKALPKYKSLDKHSSLVDNIIRTYKSSGSEAALKLTVPDETADTHQKSIGLAFRIALGETGVEWQYTREEIDHAKHLSPLARTLLEAEGEEYDSILRRFMRDAGVQDSIVRK